MWYFSCIANCRLIEWKANVVFTVFIWDLKILTSKNAHNELLWYSNKAKKNRWCNCKRDIRDIMGRVGERNRVGSSSASRNRALQYNLKVFLNYLTCLCCLSLLTDKWTLKIFHIQIINSCSQPRTEKIDLCTELRMDIGYFWSVCRSRNDASCSGSCSNFYKDTQQWWLRYA
jgi:hypothetical protein